MANFSLTQQSITLPKRTRVNVRQSKHGCLTCRARKVKCDETKPTCLRCLRASKACEGYGIRAQTQQSQYETSSSDAETSSSGLESRNCTPPTTIRVLSNGFQLSSQESSHIRLGLEVLLQQRLEQARWNELPSWIRFISQSLAGNNAVNSAMIYLGAAFEAHCLPDSSTQPRISLARNQKALDALLREVASPNHDLISVFLASVVLAAAEALQRHLANALIHLRGAFRALTSVITVSARSPDSSTPSACHEGFRHDTHDLYAFATSLDLQTSWYMLSEPPRLSPGYHSTNDSNLSAESNILCLLHSCYHFTNRAGEFKYRHHAETPSPLVLEQSRHIAALTDWLATSKQPTKESKGSVRQYLVQRAQCLSTLIYVSTILSPYEVTYDLYSTHFHQIVESSKNAIAISEDIFSTSSLTHFKTQPDLFQAVYLTAMKCRDPCLRREAVSLLSQFGIEGPWNARVMTRVAQRAIEIEEMHQPTDQPRLPIPETRRLHGCGVDSEAPLEKTLPISIQAHFSLCESVERMVDSRNPEESEEWTLWSEHLEVRDFNSDPLCVEEPVVQC